MQGAAADGLEVAAPGEPCRFAHHATSAADLKTEIPRWEPHSARLTDAWTCGDTPVLLFGDIQVSYETGWSDVPVPRKWVDLADDYGGNVQTVLGKPAYVHPNEAKGSNVEVMLVVDGVLIRVLATEDVPIENYLT